LIEYDGTEPALDDKGRPITRWDGRTTKPHPVTGREVPDENARVTVLRYINPRKAEWPEADFIVGNPPFVGTKRMRTVLGDGYVDVVRQVYSYAVEDNADFVMYWWNHAAELVRGGASRRFGFITTNSVTQSFNRRVLTRHLDAECPLKLAWAIPDHPWVDAEDGAAVRVAMTVAVLEPNSKGRLLVVVNEFEQDSKDGSRAVSLVELAGKVNAEPLPVLKTERVVNRLQRTLGATPALRKIWPPDRAEEPRARLNRLPNQAAMREEAVTVP